MRFGSLTFALTFALFLTAFIRVQSVRARIASLAAFNLLFYASQSWRYLPLLLCLTGVTYFFSMRLADVGQKRKTRDLILALSVVLAVLVLFRLFQIAPRTSHWLAPLGLSYMALQLMGYAIDARRGKDTPRGFLNFVAAVTFFPVVTAGPILRTADLMRQFSRGGQPSWYDYRSGTLLICNGFFKKTVADLLASSSSFSAEMSSVETWLAILALSARIYADFSGYTDIAVGVAQLLGYKVPENFHLPYLARSVAEHWRRWHISLYEWFRSYVFFPLTVTIWTRLGERARRHEKIFSTFGIVSTITLIGLWHEFSLKYFLWALYNGVLICLSPILNRPFQRIPYGTVLQIGFAFLLIALGRVLAESSSIGSAYHVWRAAFGGGSMIDLAPNFGLRCCMVAFALIGPHLIDLFIISRRQEMIESFVWFPTSVLLLTFSIVFSTPGRPFLYVF